MFKKCTLVVLFIGSDDYDDLLGIRENNSIATESAPCKRPAASLKMIDLEPMCLQGVIEHVSLCLNFKY